MPRRADLVGAAPLFAALGDETRLRLVVRLCDDGPMSISRLTTEAGADVSRQAVTKHLRVMHDAGIVKERRLGRESIWELEPRKLDEARNYLAQIEKQWDDAITRLKVFVERD